MDEIDLIVRSFLEPTPARRQRLQAWRERSLANEKAYREMVRIWELAGDTVPEERTSPPPSAREILFRRSRRGLVGRSNRSDRIARRVWPVMAIAASVLLVLGGHHILSLPSDEDAAFGATEFVTGPGEMVTARLNDGTVVKLAPSSRLRARGTARTREVWLDGRAFFAVARDESRPFTVRTRAGDALVLGTRFEVLLDQQDLRVVVVEGKVALSAGDEVVEVEAGQIANVADGAPPGVSSVADLEPYTGWLGNFIVFQSTPLSSVARELERRYAVSVQISDPDLEEKTVTAWFNDESLREIVSVVCRVVAAHCTVQGSVVHIEP